MNQINETEKIELKKSTSELKEGIISIVSMLNKHQEGKLYFGVSNGGKVVGQTVTENSLREVSRAISENIEPKIYPEVKKEKIEGKDCIVVEFKGNNAPYFAYGRAYIRVADEDRQLSASELKKMFFKNKEHLWELSISEKTLSDIDKSLLKRYIRRANEAKRINFRFTDVTSVLKKLNLLKDDKLLKAAEALFCKNVSFEVQCAVFAGAEKLTFLDIRQYTGNIFKLIEESNKYLIEHMNWRAELTGEGRKEIPEVPVRAIEEAVVNSLCHRDYTNPKGNEIAFFKDRIEISNPGQFPEDLTPEDYIKGEVSSVLRNPLIANTLYLSQDIERWGSGIRRIFEACGEAKVKVEFKKTKTGFTVVFYRPTSQVTELEKREFGGKAAREKTREKTREKIILLVKNNPKITSEELAHEIGISIKGVEWNIKRLKDENIIGRVGPDKGGRWVVIK